MERATTKTEAVEKTGRNPTQDNPRADEVERQSRTRARPRRDSNRTNPDPRQEKETPTKTRCSGHAVIKTGHDTKQDDQEQARRKTAARHATDTRPRTEAQARPGRTHPVGKQHQHKPSGIPTSRHESPRVVTRHQESPQVLHELLRARTRTNKTPASRRVSPCGHKPHKPSRVSPRNPRHESQNRMNHCKSPQAAASHPKTTTSLPKPPQGAREAPASHCEPPQGRPEKTTGSHRKPPRVTASYCESTRASARTPTSRRESPQVAARQPASRPEHPQGARKPPAPPPLAHL